MLRTKQETEMRLRGVDDTRKGLLAWGCPRVSHLGLYTLSLSIATLLADGVALAFHSPATLHPYRHPCLSFYQCATPSAPNAIQPCFP